MNDTIQQNKLALFTEQLTLSNLAFSSDLKEEALAVLTKSDFPTTRQEDWKYTRVGRIASIKASQTQENAAIKLPGTLNDTALLFVFDNGRFRADLSSLILPAGIKVKALTSCASDELSLVGTLVKQENQVFTALNTAYASDGILIHIERNQKIHTSIHVLNILSGENTASFTRNLIVCDDFSQAHIVQEYRSQEASTSVNNVITEIFVGANSHLTIDKIQHEEQGNFAVLTEQVDQKKDSTFTINTITLDGTLVRNNLNIEVNGSNCESNLNGAYLLKDNQHVDNHTIVDHKVAHCLSNELYKGIIYDKATAVFNGKVFVRKDAQKINAFQSNGNVLMSDDASVNSKPELEIYADDVKCSHGSTTGQLDDEAIFYLRARGLSEKAARNLMVSAFIGDVLDKIENPSVLKMVQSIIQKKHGWEF
jgi:Fe-S cluster assembly protein SufD